MEGKAYLLAGNVEGIQDILPEVPNALIVISFLLKIRISSVRKRVTQEQPMMNVWECPVFRYYFSAFEGYCVKVNTVCSFRFC